MTGKKQRIIKFAYLKMLEHLFLTPEHLYVRPRPVTLEKEGKAASQIVLNLV